MCRAWCGSRCGTRYSPRPARLLAIFFGAALGNVVRGVPLDRSGEFFLPLWTDFTAGQDSGILDWYTLLIAVAALLALTVHGALWVALKTEGEVQRRARLAAKRVWWALAAGVAWPITLASFRVQPHLKASFAERPWGYVFPLLALLGLIGMRMLDGRRRRAGGVSLLLPVPAGHADQRGVRAVSLRAAVERRPRFLADGGQLRGGALRSARSGSTGLFRECC